MVLEEKEMTKCSVEGCENKILAKGWCSTHYGRMREFGRLEKIQGTFGPNCTVNGCTKLARGKGLCNTHYQLKRKYGRPEKLNKPSKTLHPYYHLWFERKQNKDLVVEWLDFWKFVNDVGEKPEGHYFIIRLRDNEPYGPYNFEWREKLKQKEDETEKEWHARKWEDRRIRDPEWDYDRNLQRKYGINISDYNRMHNEQDGKCGICKRKESRIANDKLTRLSVDHCHSTGKVRGLLCFACNSTLGKYDDKIEFLKSMIDYLERHK